MELARRQALATRVASLLLRERPGGDRAGLVALVDNILRFAEPLTHRGVGGGLPRLLRTLHTRTALSRCADAGASSGRGRRTSRRRFVPDSEPRRAPRRNRTTWLTCGNAIKAQVLLEQLPGEAQDRYRHHLEHVASMGERSDKVRGLLTAVAGVKSSVRVSRSAVGDSRWSVRSPSWWMWQRLRKRWAFWRCGW